MQKFTKHTGKPVPMLQSNIDTDQILPKQFLTRIDKSGYGDCLFYDWRFDADGEPNPEFVLNKLAYKAASVLIAGKNFGGGSSREHAPWALQDYGFRVLLAASFADIFYNNCFKIGLLPIVLDEKTIARLAERAKTFDDYLITADLQNLEIYDNRDFKTIFQIDEFRRELLLEGLDEIGLTLRYESEIGEYEKRRADWLVSVK